MTTPPIISIKGTSGTHYTFYIYPLPVKFSVNGGVYFYTKCIDGKPEHHYVYVGITNDLSTRFDNHHKGDDIKKAGANHICILWEENEAKRVAIEKDILTAVTTICNDKLN